MKKRIFSVCLVLVLLAGLLAGCGKQDDVQTPGNDGADGTGTCLLYTSDAADD